VVLGSSAAGKSKGPRRALALCVGFEAVSNLPDALGFGGLELAQSRTVMIVSISLIPRSTLISIWLTFVYDDFMLHVPLVRLSATIGVLIL